MFDAYEHPDHSPVLIWLPISMGLVATAVVALALCPVPRSQTISPGSALVLAVAYVALTIGIGAAIFAASAVLIARQGPRTSVRQVLPLFCSVAAWMAPMIAFYNRDSLWAAYTAGVVGSLVAALVYRHHFEANAYALPPAITESKPEVVASQRPRWLKLAAILFQFSVLAALASMGRPSAILLGAAAFIVACNYLAAISPRPRPSRYQKSSHTSFAVAMAMVFAAASLTPYLTMPAADDAAEGAGLTSHHSATATKPYSNSSEPLVQYLKSLFLPTGAAPTRKEEQHAPVDSPSPADAPYPVLQALFGEQQAAGESQLSSLEKKRKNRRSMTLLNAESYPGVILRPPIEDHSPIVPPLPRRTVFEGKPNDLKDDPVSIPFYGAYWYFRASDGSLPADSIESRGDPATMSFKTTDFSAIAMEARQSFGTLIDLTCCQSVELVISNGDRRPGTIAVELILANTTVPGKPWQSLGICPVRSTERWSPHDDRAPVTETLRFRVPPHRVIRNFNEATVRFQMQSPRERWSAKIAVLKFRLIPHGL